MSHIPGRDGTGPMGRGAKPGRGFGPCSGTNAVQYDAGLGLGSTLRCRRGYGQGFGKNNNADQASSNTPKEWLQEQRDAIQRRLDAIDKQLEDL